MLPIHFHVLDYVRPQFEIGVLEEPSNNLKAPSSRAVTLTQNAFLWKTYTNDNFHEIE